jgi:mRNA-degrading endonuclease RelE of RelBE toxin-antitoxin system
MPTTVKSYAPFQKELRRLARKYPKVAESVNALSAELKNDERPGDLVPDMGGYDIYKVRLPNPSAARGKSGGFRVIYYLQLVDHVILLTIYSKTEQTDITPAEIRQILDELDATPPDTPEDPAP